MQKLERAHSDPKGARVCRMHQPLRMPPHAPLTPSRLHGILPNKDSLMPDYNPDPTLDPTTNPAAQEALSRLYGNASVIILPLTRGGFAILDRSFYLHAILDEPPDANDLRAYSDLFATRLAQLSRVAAESAFYGEPGADALARDIRRGHQQFSRRPRTLRDNHSTEAIEIDL